MKGLLRCFLHDHNTPILYHTETNCPHSFSITVWELEREMMMEETLLEESDWWELIGDRKCDVAMLIYKMKFVKCLYVSFFIAYVNLGTAVTN